MRRNYYKFIIAVTFLMACVGTTAGLHAAPVAQSQATGQTQAIEAGYVTIDFKDADIRNVLRVISLKGGVNIVAGPDVEGLITIRLTNVPWEKALDVILKTYGFDYEYDTDSNIIRVVSQEMRELEAQAKAKILEAQAQARKLDVEPFVTRVYKLNYTTDSAGGGTPYISNITTPGQSAAEESVAPILEIVEKILTNIEGRKGIASYEPRTNSLVVTDTEAKHVEIEKLVLSLDTKTKQVMIEAKIVEATTDDDLNLGIDWTMRATASGSALPTTFPFNKGRAPFSADNFFPVGDPAETDPGFPSIGEQGGGFPFTNSTLVASSTSPVLYKFGSLDASEFSAVLEILNEKTETNILSNPTLTTLDNKEANILVGTIILLPTFERNSDTGTLEVSGYNERQVGIRLRVTPHVTDQNNIVIDLKPEISEIGTSRSYGTISFPDIITREASTQVMVRNGHTIVIGGLIKTKTTDVENKVPVLGSIPIVGKLLFTKSEEGVDKTELLFFITVNIVDDDRDIAGVPHTSDFTKLPAFKDTMKIKEDAEDTKKSK